MVVASEELRKGAQVAGRQTVTYCGLRFRVNPEFWLRRLFRFPFYFESTNPSFRVEIKRVSEPPPGDEWEGDSIVFEIVFADETTTRVPTPIPDLKMGESKKAVLRNVYTAYPGQTIIRLPVKSAIAGWRPAEWKTLYSYQVRPEEQLWLAVIGPFAGLLFGVGAAILGVVIDRALG